jgi:eukaryotic-like serine/threonine-protein kinase
MGQVFLAQHTRIARRVAVKVLLPELSSNEGVIERFFTEARATSLIRHPGIVEVLDCDVLDGQAFIVMEYLAGESLATYLLRTGGLRADLPFALAIAQQVANAVAAAHAAEIVHRDLKPDNVFLCANATDHRVVPKVLDFGIAKVALQGAATQTRTGALIGTPTYMSPEQCRGGSKLVDGRSDIYSLGCILYESFCGRPPFVRDGTGDLIVAHVAERPDPPRTLVSTLPPALDALVMRMLAKSPEERPQTMIEVSSEIAACLHAVGGRPPVADIQPSEAVLLPMVEADLRADAARAIPPTARLAPNLARQQLVPRAGATAVLTPEIATAIGGIGGPTTLRGATGERASETFRDAPRRSSMRGLFGLVTAAAIGSLALVFVFSRAKTPENAIQQQAAPGAPPPVVSAPAGPTRASVPPPQVVTVEMRGLPIGADIMLDGAPISGPRMAVRRDGAHHLVLVHARGYEDRTVRLDADRDQVIDVTLAVAAAVNPNAGAGGARSRSTHHRPRRSSAADSSGEAQQTAPPRTPSATPQPKRSAYDDM